MADADVLHALAELSKLLLRRLDFIQVGADRVSRGHDVYANELRGRLDAVVRAHEQARTSVSGLAVITAAMLVRDEGMEVLQQPSQDWQQTRQAIERALATV